MDRKITELDSIEKLAGNEYFVIASASDNENYKIRIEDFLTDDVVSGSGFGGITVDDHLSLTSTNPVQNKVITAELEAINDRIDDLDGTSGGSGGGSGSATTFDLRVASVETETLAAGKSANVEITDLGTVNNVKSLAFAFAIPRGADGISGGDGSGDGYESFGTRTVFAFRTFTPSVAGEKPATPTGGSWDPETNTVTYPTGWGPSDDLERPVWMSNATFDYKGIVVDWSTPIQISGSDGSGSEGDDSDGSDIDKVLEFIYKQTADEVTPDKPQNLPLVDDYIPRDEGWDDHPNGVGYIETDEGKTLILCEWVCTRSYDNGTGAWLDWEGPVLWSKYGENGKDGDGVEYIYTLSSTYDNKPATPGTEPADHSPTTNYQDREFIPSQTTTVDGVTIENEFPWSDNPSDVSLSVPFEWVSVRKFQWDTQEWGPFGEPTLWAKYGKDGDEAVGYFKSFVFTRSNETPVKPEGGDYGSPIPDSPIDSEGNPIWTDGIPTGSEIVWMSTRVFTADGEAPQQDEWTDPAQMTDTADFEVIYSPATVASEPPALTADSKVGAELTDEWKEAAANVNWYDDPYDWNVEGNTHNGKPAIWMATNKAKNGVWQGWVISQILGEKGETGTSISIQGSFDSYEALIEAWNNGALPKEPEEIGDCYVINGELWVFDGDSWFNAGTIKGDPGRGIYKIETKYAVNDSNASAPSENATNTWFSTSPATNDTDKKYLWKWTKIIYTEVDDNGTDEVDIFELIGVHGDKGIDGDTTEYIFLLSNEPSASNITVPTTSDPIDTNEIGKWTDDAQGPGTHSGTFYKYEYVSSHVKAYNEDTGEMEWGAYGPASLWATYGEDGRGIDYIYAEYGTGASIDDHSDVTNWADSSPAVTEAKPYLWKRTLIYFTDGTNSDAYDYECIGKMGDPGVDGKDIEFAFLLTEKNTSVPSAPSGNVTGNTPGSWTDDAQMLGNYDSDNEWIGTSTDDLTYTYKFQWVSKRVRESDSEWGAWSTPTLWSELYPGLFLHIKYSNDIENKVFTGNNGEDVGKYIGVLTDYNEGDSADFDDYTWRKFEGNDGFYREYIFKLSATSVNVSVPTSDGETDQTEQYVPTGWSADPISPTSTYKYCMACHRDYKDGAWGAWKGNSTTEYKYAYIFSMYAEAIQGDPGQPGPIVYPAGQWQDDVTYTADVTTDSEGNETVTATPYVYWNSAYYLLKTKSSDLGTNPASDVINWTEMYTTEAIYTNVLVADRALVGDAVFNANYMFSQHGIDQSGNSLVGTEYKNFNSSDPYNASNDFRPNWCVNFLTGEQWSGAGKIYFAADGSGYLADGAISWDEEGNITKMPAGKAATINAVWTTNSATSANVSISLSEGYTGTVEGTVELYDPDGNYGTAGAVIGTWTYDLTGGITDKTITNSKTGATTISLWIRLTIDGVVVAKAPVSAPGGGTTVEVPKTKVTIKASGSYSDNWFVQPGTSNGQSAELDGFEIAFPTGYSLSNAAMGFQNLPTATGSPVGVAVDKQITRTYLISGSSGVTITNVSGGGGTVTDLNNGIYSVELDWDTQTCVVTFNVDANTTNPCILISEV